MTSPTTERFMDEYTPDETPAPPDSSVVVKGNPMIQVVAPATLKEGYTFEAEISPGQTYTVTVPPGGVTQGQSFLVPGIPTESLSRAPPVGAWKDGLFNCFRYGICHPHLCLAFWCRPLALAQVMVRMRLNWCGRPDGVAAVAQTFSRVFILYAVYYVLDNVICFAASGLAPPPTTTNAYDWGMTDDAIIVDETYFYPSYDEYYNSKASVGYLVLNSLHYGLYYSFFIYFMVILIRTRQAVRAKYAIAEDNCSGCEDCLCACCCTCCTIMQMSRHTADYDKYPGQCCTETGLPSHVDAMV